MGLTRGAVGVVVGLAAGADAKVSGMAAEVMGTTKAVTMGAKGIAETKGP